MRTFVFEATNTIHADLAGKSPVFRLYRYTEGGAPVLVQRGTYEITEGHLVVTLIWASTPDAGSVGTSYANAILDWSAERLVLESTSAASGERVFTPVDPGSFF